MAAIRQRFTIGGIMVVVALFSVALCLMKSAPVAFLIASLAIIVVSLFVGTSIEVPILVGFICVCIGLLLPALRQPAAPRRPTNVSNPSSRPSGRP